MLINTSKISGFFKGGLLTIWKNVLLAVIYIFSAVATFVVCINSIGNLIFALIVGFTVESIKIIFGKMYHKEKNIETDRVNIWLWVYILLWVFFVVISIVFSSASIMDEMDSKDKQTKYSSQEYIIFNGNNKEMEEEIKRLSARYDTLNKAQKTKDDIVNAEVEYNKNKSNLQKELIAATKQLSALRNAMSNIPVTTKTQRLRADKEQEIKAKQTSINSIETQLKNLAPAGGNSAEDAKEMMEIMNELKQLRKEKESKNIAFNESDNHSSWFRRILRNIFLSETAFWIIFAIALEASGFILLRDKKLQYSSKESTIKNYDEAVLELANKVREQILPNEIPLKAMLQNNANSEIINDVLKNNAPNDFNTKSEIKNNALIVDSGEGNTNDFNIKPEISLRKFKLFTKQIKFTTGECKKYVDYMYANPKREGISVGYKQISQKIGIEEETGRKIKGFLEQQGIVEVEGRDTKFLVSKKDCFKILSQK